MELHEIHAIVDDLVRVRWSKPGALEFQDRDEPGSQEDAIDAKPPPSEVVLEDNVRVGGQARFVWCNPKNLELGRDVRANPILHDADARVPLLVLLRFNMPALSSGGTGKLGDD